MAFTHLFRRNTPAATSQKRAEESRGAFGQGSAAARGRLPNGPGLGSDLRNQGSQSRGHSIRGGYGGQDLQAIPAGLRPGRAQALRPASSGRPGEIFVVTESGCCRLTANVSFTLEPTIVFYQGVDSLRMSDRASALKLCHSQFFASLHRLRTASSFTCTDLRLELSQPRAAFLGDPLREMQVHLDLDPAPGRDAQLPSSGSGKKSRCQVLRLPCPALWQAPMPFESRTRRPHGLRRSLERNRFRLPGMPGHI